MSALSNDDGRTLSDAGIAPQLFHDGPKAAAPREVLTPAPRPQAILVPPLVLGGCAYLATVFAASPVAALTAASPWGWGLVLCLASLIPSALILTWSRAHGSKVGALFAPANALLLAALAAWAIGGISAGPVLLSCATSFLAAMLWKPWQDAWTENRLERVSLLAATTLGAFEAICRLEAVPWVRVTSACVPDADPDLTSQLLKRPVYTTLGGYVQLEHRVIVACPMRDPAVGRAIAELVARGYDLTSESATLRHAEGRVDVSRVEPLSLLMGRRRSKIQDAASRLLDIVLSLVLLVVTAPLLVLCAVGVAIGSGLPVLYRQRCVGRGGRPIGVLRFRSMRRDAETRSEPAWANDADPRTTRVGRLLRRCHLDALPQLWNVLVGDMALVGPRPERPQLCEVLREYVPLFELRTLVRPGLTGWAQVRLGSDEWSDESRSKLEYDLYYVTHRSPWFDLAVLAETVRVALIGPRAGGLGRR